MDNLRLRYNLWRIAPCNPSMQEAKSRSGVQLRKQLGIQIVACFINTRQILDLMIDRLHREYGETQSKLRTIFGVDIRRQGKPSR